MKSRRNLFFKLIVSLVLSNFFLASGCSCDRGGKVQPRALRVAFPFSSSVQYKDPGSIIYASQYIFFENIYSPLVEFAKNGEIVPGVASHFEWKGDEAHFRIRNDLKTIDGRAITAQDAAASLKRLIALTGNTHGNIKALLCPNRKIELLSDECPGIEVRDDVLVLRPGEKKAFLLPMLAAIDFAVIPLSSIDPKTLEVTDLRNTSGPYFVERDLQAGSVLLRANSHHYHYSRFIPQSIELLGMDLRKTWDSIDRFRRNEVDLITTIDPVTSDRLLDFAKSNAAEVSLHRTQPLKIYAAAFTKRGLKEIDSDGRHFLALQMKQLLRKQYSGKAGFENTDQFFPVFGDAGLRGIDAQELDQFLNSNGEWPESLKGKEILISVADKSILEFTEKSLDGLRSIVKPKVFFSDTPAAMEKVPLNQLPHVEIFYTDTGYFEDISLISYNMSVDQFGLGVDEGKVWLDRYMRTIAKEDRIRQLRRLHKKALIDPVIVPVASSPYIAVVRKPWKMNLPDMFANNPFWQITYEQ